jgi:hypothetical protein
MLISIKSSVFSEKAMVKQYGHIQRIMDGKRPEQVIIYSA